MNDLNENVEVEEELADDGSPSGIEAETYEPYPFDVERISISNKKMALSNILSRWGRGWIHAALLQRRDDLWDNGRKSRLIESLMLRIPLPLFYAAETKDDHLYVVDGLQRLSAIRGYVSEKKYTLKSLEFLKELEGLDFDSLPERMQIRINETELDFAVIGPDSPQDVQRNIFKRLNTGGLPLSDQEIRHALYFGPVTDFLKELAETNEFRTAVNNSINDSRMAAEELILRFLSFSLMGNEAYKKDGEMDSFLSDAMRIFNALKEKKPADFGRNILTKDIDSLKEKFIVAMQRATELFGSYAFRISTPNSARRTAVNKSLFEAWSVLLSDMSAQNFEKLKSRKTLLYEKIDAELDGKPQPDSRLSLRDSISRYSPNIAGIKGRYSILREIIDRVIREGK